jgi:UDP-N-acetylglucosamine 4,6-dehydratase/5-epimerase
MKNNAFLKKNILITGGTGSFGSSFINYLLRKKYKFNEIRILSRDEKKQDDLRKILNNKKIKFIIGDVRDPASLDFAIKNVDFIFHAAALKQVPSCEFYPLEAYKTNVMGTNNVIEKAIQYKVKKIICLSTDKAVYPINAMGISKAMMEKVALSKALNEPKFTQVCVTRYGNVLGTRGSIVPTVLNQIFNKSPITITNYNMTRFLMTMDKAIELVLFALHNGKNGDLFVQKTPSATIKTLIEALLSVLNKKKYLTNVIGERHGEKLHETLMSREEASKATEYKNYFLIRSDTRSLNYESYFNKGTVLKKLIKSYSSDDVKLLNVRSVIKLLEKLDLIKNFRS